MEAPRNQGLRICFQTGGDQIVPCRTRWACRRGPLSDLLRRWACVNSRGVYSPGGACSLKDGFRRVEVSGTQASTVSILFFIFGHSVSTVPFSCEEKYRGWCLIGYSLVPLSAGPVISFIKQLSLTPVFRPVGLRVSRALQDYNNVTALDVRSGVAYSTCLCIKLF
ncbi:hypothetical protein HID58_092681 [Brassica napus]|uniref:Uncharacterized protein n=1 Tax=Brassica napus TaxID=3708 RepID=A0ABQ7XGB8_BRANA|nr:hypothetical protein HID58_092681 [Brassica napus]